MLIQFTVKNFMSFKDTAVLSLNPSSDGSHEENMNYEGDYKLLNTVAIYGANASGKSSLFRAMTSALKIVSESNIRQVNDPIFVSPFKFNEKSVSQPSEFEFIFVASDGYKYVYGFSVTSEKVYEEYLYQYKSQKPTVIFERNEKNEYLFKSKRKELEPLVRFNTTNKMFLSTATNWNTECTLIPYNWLIKKIMTFTYINDMSQGIFNIYKGKEQEEYVSFAEKLLKMADIGVSKINIEVKKEPINNPVMHIEQERIRVFTEHKVGNGKQAKYYKLGLEEESTGTSQLFMMAPILKVTLDQGMTLVVDELEKSLHPYIVKFLVNMFRDKELNVNGAQLIFTTHVTSLLSLDIFRRDQIYFTEKNNETGESDLYSLDEFSVRKTENIEKGYMQGRYGAIPYIRGEEL